MKMNHTGQQTRSWIMNSHFRYTLEDASIAQTGRTMGRATMSWGIRSDWMNQLLQRRPLHVETGIQCFIQRGQTRRHKRNKDKQFRNLVAQVEKKRKERDESERGRNKKFKRQKQMHQSVQRHTVESVLECRGSGEDKEYLVK